MDRRIEECQGLHTFFVRAQTVQSDVQNFSIVDKLLLQQVRCLAERLVTYLRARHGIDQEKQLRQAFNSRLDFCP